MIKITGTTYDDEEKIWSGPKTKNLYSTELTVGEAIVNQLLKTPRKVIQIVDSTGETLTAMEFLNHSLALADNILKSGIKCSDVVGLYARHSLHLATVMMASCLCGTPVSALFPGFDKDSVISIYANTRPKIIFCDEQNYVNALYASDQLNLNAQIVLLTGSLEGVTKIAEMLSPEDEILDLAQFPCSNLNSSDTAVLLSTSGTTGSPKISMCSHQTLLYSNIFATAHTDSVLLCFSTMYWASGLVNLFSALLNSSLRIVPDKSYSPEYFLYLVKRYGITHVFASSSQMAELVFQCNKNEIKEFLQTIDTILCGGTKIPIAVQEKCLDIISADMGKPGFCVAYGMTEIVGALTCNGGYPHDFKPHTEGKLFANKKVCIVNEKGTRMGPNETGELMVYNPYIWMGYYNNSEATEKVLNGQWLRTNDVGYFDDEGFLHLMGRKNDIFKCKSFQICPQHIEDILLRIPGVAEVCVFPIANMMEDNLIACAIVRTRYSDDKILTAEKVHDFLKENMDSFYAMKGGVYFVDVLPKTSTGKVQRNKLPAMIREATYASPS
ncbi:uncharacterized protein LOC142240673 [Haematobia irritans]|uniref:uncharacterized protein LOC142240673 n=1 Tax=Haematobia irritans TaxID=7368 RepID=UPI003F5040C5